MELKHINRWTMPANYAGETWPDYYSAGVGQSRDSDALESSNFGKTRAVMRQRPVTSPGIGSELAEIPI